ncbi:flagellar motor protein MotB [Alkalibacterium olivapovliticus]|uniref:Chemotaxis protein MotB n=1 Tax=Alkalibacterium olivapovliticus TaxID=99907 RepID=A0A2T0VYV8_9LACT|nr:flagellar motor protein MotB [Alkalibacterium olivapovliticus]PRY77511.1 chemotaxis protein MotB [Alkalibacterium olivapovliticus]
MARKRKKAKKIAEASSPAWMATFSDLMSLLLTFFILLFSMSIVSEERFREVADSLRMALVGSSSDSILDESGQSLIDLEFDEYGELKDSEAIDPDDLVSEETPIEENAVPEQVVELFDTVNLFLVEEGLNADVTLSRDQDGVYIDIQEAIMFEPGSATLRDNGLETMTQLAGLFVLLENEIIIEGYTDDVPTNSVEFETNWELSTARAVTVLRYLYENHSIDPTRLSARGYGEYSPTVPNDSAQNRSLNRRVNIVIVHDEREEVGNGSE